MFMDSIAFAFFALLADCHKSLLADRQGTSLSIIADT